MRHSSLLAVGGGAGGEVAEDSEEAGGGALVGERFQVDGRGEVRGVWTEAHAEQVVSARSHQRVDHGRKLLFPLGASGQHDGAGTDDCPVARVSDQFVVAVGEPAMPEHFQMNARGAIQIRFEGQRLSLLVPGTQQPRDG